MNCPECGDKTKCLDTRVYDEPTKGFEYVQRIRECLTCKERFNTIEIEVSVWLEETDGDS